MEWPLELERYRAGQDVMVGLVSDAAGVGLNRTRLASPVSPLLRINLGDAFSVCLAHGRRHMDQIRRLRSLPDFPKAPPTD